MHVRSAQMAQKRKWGDHRKIGAEGSYSTRKTILL
jgi:hypothetical protein